MREHQPNTAHDLAPSPEPWLPRGICAVLASEPYEAEDDLYGSGEGHFFGPTGESRIAFYPAFQTAEFENSTDYLVFKKPIRIKLSETAVMLETEGEVQSTFFAVDRDGQVTHTINLNPEVIQQVAALDRLGNDRLNGGADTSSAAREPDTLLLATADPTSSVEPLPVPLPSETAAPGKVASGRENLIAVDVLDDRPEPPLEPPPVPAEKRKAERVEFTGRIGRIPQFKTTQRGTLMARFPVAEHVKAEGADEVTTWYTVAVFNALAASLKGQIDAGEVQQGDEVRVVGYPQTRNVSDGKGGMKEIQEIFAAVVTKRPERGAKRA